MITIPEYSFNWSPLKSDYDRIEIKPQLHLTIVQLSLKSDYDRIEIKINAIILLSISCVKIRL